MSTNIKQVSFADGPQIYVVQEVGTDDPSITADGLTYACHTYEETDYGVKFTYTDTLYSSGDYTVVLPWHMVRRVFQAI